MLDRLVGGVRGWHLNAGIVECHVAVLCDGAVDHCGHLRLVGDVAGDAYRGAALQDDPLGLLRRKIAVYVGQHHGGAALCEDPRRRKAHAFGGGRDQGHLAFEVIDRVHLELHFMLRSFDQAGGLRFAQPTCELVSSWRCRRRQSLI
jgi:hypothetical protein